MTAFDDYDRSSYNIFVLSYLLLAVGLQSAPSQGMDAHVTYTTRAARASVVVPEIGKLAGFDLETSPQTANEILLISVKDFPVSELLKHIATVTSGQWRHEGAAFRLVESKEVRKQEEQEALAKHLADLDKFLSREGGLQKLVLRQKADSTKIDGSVMLSNLIRKFALKIAELQPGERLVFASNPTQFELPLGDSGCSIVRKWSDKYYPDPKIPKEYHGPTWGTKPERSKLIFLVARPKNSLSSNGYAFNVEIEGNGRFAEYSPTADLALINGDFSLVDYPANEPKQKPDPDTGALIPYSEDSREMMRIETYTPNQVFYSASDKMQGMIDHPDRYDPLSYGVTDELLALAQAERKQIIADVPDDVSPCQGIDFKPIQSSLKEISRRISAQFEMRTIPDPRILLLKPSRPSENRNQRLDRVSLARLLESGTRMGLPSLDEIATFALHNPVSRCGDLLRQYFVDFIEFPSYDLDAIAPKWSLFRLYGLLTPDQKETLLSGGKLPLGALTSAQRREAEHLVYGSPKLASYVPADPFESLMVMGRAVGNNKREYPIEPTLIAPNGLPHDGFMDMSVTQESFGRPMCSSGSYTYGHATVICADEFAWLKMVRRLPISVDPYPFPDLGKLRIGERRLLNFTIHLTPEVVVKSTLSDHFLPKDAPQFRETELPIDLQKQIEDHLERLKDTPDGKLLDQLVSNSENAIKIHTR